MKKTFRPATLFVSLMIMGSTLGLTSCSDDDDVVDNPIEVTTKTMYGDYEGKMTTMASTLSKSEELVGVNVKANVDNDTVCIKNFPIKDVVMSIVGDEAVADDIVALVGDIDYKIGYKPALSSAKDFILMVMEPEPLKINLKMPTQEGKEAQTMAIEVKVTASDNAAYGVEESKLKFDITATEVMLGEGAVVAAGALVLQNSLDPRTGKTNTITVFKQNRAALASNPIMNSVFAKLKQYME